MSGPEVVIAAEAAAATTAAAEAAATAEAISAAIAAAEAEAAMIAAAEAAASTAAAEGAAATGAFDAGLGLDAMMGGEGLLMNPIDAARIAAEQEVAQINAMNAYAGQIDPFQQFLKYGYEDAPGSTMRSIQSGFANNPLNTLKSLPQFMGMPAAGAGVQTPYGATIAKQMLAGSGKPQGTNTTTTTGAKLRPGQQVNMIQPIASLLAPQIRRRRGISLI